MLLIRILLLGNLSMSSGEWGSLNSLRWCWFCFAGNESSSRLKRPFSSSLTISFLQQRRLWVQFMMSTSKFLMQWCAFEAKLLTYLLAGTKMVCAIISLSANSNWLVFQVSFTYSMLRRTPLATSNSTPSPSKPQGNTIILLHSASWNLFSRTCFLQSYGTFF